MTNETVQYTCFTQETIDATLTEYFDDLSQSDPDNKNPTPHEIAIMVRDLLNEYINGDIETARHSFNYFVGCSVENIDRQEQVKRIMRMLKQLNESNKSLAQKYQVLCENYRTLQEEHETLMEEYLS